MKVLILSCKTGGGHDAAGRAILEQLQQMGEEAYLFDYLTLAGQKVSDRVGGGYVGLVQRVPLVFGLLYRIGAIVSRLVRKSPVYYMNGLMAPYLDRYLQEHQFDAIVMPHLFPAETITYMKRKGMDLPLTVAVATDYTCIQPHSRRTFAAFVAASIYTALMIPQKSVVVALCLMSFVVLHKHAVCEREHADA